MSGKFSLVFVLTLAALGLDIQYCMAQQSLPSSVVEVDASAPSVPVAPTSFHGGTAINPRGERISMNSHYLLLNDHPWLPVMGEFHYTRVPESQWEEEILKMKAAGVQIVATYVFWIHHEEIEGQFDWGGRRDLRHFVELCAKHGMYVYPRIGPWAHGEVRNGGLPDWVLNKTKKIRQNDPVYLFYADRYYDEIAKQLKGLLWKDGGPVIGIQLENEYSMRGPGAGEEHILKLKEMAISHGLDVPIYSVTGWDNAVVPKGAVVAVFGGYPDAPWDASLTDLPAAEVYTFRFGSRVTGNMGMIGHTHSAPKPSDSYDFPFMTAEMGGGVQGTYHRRPVIAPDDVAAMIPVMLGSGVNLYGSYMFQGGQNPHGKLTTLQESQATGYPSDVPVKSYDFQAPLGEFGEERPIFRKMKIVNYFLNDFGSILAPMEAYRPTKLPVTPSDTGPARVSVRTDGESGFLFFNNYIRNTSEPIRHGFQAIIKLRSETLRLPNHPIDLPSGDYGIWPFNLSLDSIRIRYATAQLFTKTADATGVTFYFLASKGVPSEFSIEDSHESTPFKEGRRDGTEGVKSYRLLTPMPSTEPFLTQKSAAGTSIKLVLLSEEQAENAWKIKTKNRDLLFLTTDQFYADNSRVTLQSEGNPNFTFSILPSNAGKPVSIEPLRKTTSTSGSSSYSCSVPSVDPKLSVVRIQKAGQVPTVKIGPALSWRPHGVAIAPTDEAFLEAAKWRLSVSDSAWTGVHNLFLVIHYDGDVGRLSSVGHLLEDNFYNGLPWQIGLNRFRDAVAGKDFQLEILPRRADAPIFLERQYRSPNVDGVILDLKSISLVPLYQIQMDF